MSVATRPFPPGAYPVVVVGSGPGGLQLSHALTEEGIDHAVISQDPAPGGMFRRWPYFQRLLSWTKPHAPVERGTRAYERYDWNSLLTEQAAARALQPTFMDGTSYFPSRPEMEANLAAFAERARVAVRYGCAWTGTRIEENAGGTVFRRRNDRRRVPLPRARPGRRRRRAARSRRAGDRACPSLRRGQARRVVRREAGVHPRQAELGVRAGERAAAVGAPDRAVLAIADLPERRHALARRGARPLCPAV